MDGQMVRYQGTICLANPGTGRLLAQSNCMYLSCTCWILPDAGFDSPQTLTELLLIGLKMPRM